MSLSAPTLELPAPASSTPPPSLAPLPVPSPLCSPQIHTTGMDIRHRLTARAVVTLGKDSTWRDYAQGAYRMRGIGKGQSCQLLLTPEVLTRVDSTVCMLCCRCT